MAWYAGIDVGATNVRAVVATEAAAIEGRCRQSTPQSAGIAVTETILDTLRTACTEAGIDPPDLTAAGIGSMGPLDTAGGLVRNPPNLPESVEQIPLTGPVQNLVDGPVYLHNDANAGVIGERFFAETNPDNMAYVTISSGVGAGIIVDGTVLSGWDGNAGEVGHIPVDSEGAMRCGCGKRGHWEAYCSGNNIPRYAAHLHEGEPTDLPLSADSFDAADVFALAGTDDFADRVLDRVAEWNARGLATIVHAYAPIVVYVGGAVVLNNSSVIERMRERVPDLVMTNVPDIQETTLGDDVVVKGALASAMTEGTGSSLNQSPQ
jgi:glucokinase